jgi:hypothetical protein
MAESCPRRVQDHQRRASIASCSTMISAAALGGSAVRI